MFKYFKQFLSDIKIIADCHKLYQDYKGYFFGILLSITSISGWYIMIQEILGAVLISTPIIYLIYLTKQNKLFHLL